MKILFLVPYPLNEAPSQRFRFEQYFLVLKRNEHEFMVHPFLSSHDWKIVRQSGNGFLKGIVLIACWFKRLLWVVHSTRYQIIFIHREACPYGPPFFEWLMVKVFHKKIVYDFDDAIWLTDKAHESWLEKTIRWRSKVASICSWSYKISCGNEYLANYARQFNKNVIINPTTIDTSHHAPSRDGKGTARVGHVVTIGWTGSHSTLKYLEELEPALQQLEDRFPNVNILVIADKPPILQLKRLEYLAWNKATEAADLSKIDIGIMPLPDNEWTRGKCGFKALQYLAMEIPAVVSPVGVNKEIVEPGVTGYWAHTLAEWVDRLSTLVEDQEMRRQMGKKGREWVTGRFSVDSNSSRFLGLFH